MAALLGRSLFVIRAAVGSSSFSVFSSSAAVEHTSLVASILENSPSFPCIKALPSLPIPDGFPFTVTDNVYALTFTRQDKDERFKVNVGLKSHHLIDGDLCFPMYTYMRRGYWGLHLDIIAGPKTLLVQEARISPAPGHRFRSFEEFLESKGIDKGFITSLLSLRENKDESIDA